jgi:purine-binding chemotaxis protein CheW
VEAAEAVAEPDANESQATEPTDKPSLPPAADEGDAEDDREDGVPSEWPFEEQDGVPSEWPFEEDGAPSERPLEEDEEVCHLLDELIAAIDQDVGQTLQPEAVAGLAAAAPARPEDEEQYVIFTLTGAEYAVPISNVIEIGRPLNVTPVPNVPNWVVGVANLRGDIISVVDLPAFLGMERTGYGHASRMLVAQAYQGQLTTGLIVDRVSGIWYLPVDQIGAPAAPIEDRVTPYLHGVYEHDGQLLVVLDLDRLLLSPEMRQFEPV